MKTAMNMEKASICLQNNASIAVSIAAYVVTCGVLKKCRENSANTYQYRHFSDMILECIDFIKALKNNDFTFISDSNGDATQCAWTAHETLLQCIEKSLANENNANAYDLTANADYFDTDDLYKIARSFFAEKKRTFVLDKRVKIQVDTSKAIKTEMLSAFQLASRNVRKYVENHVSPDARRQKFVYMDEKVRIYDENSLTYEDTLYIEFPYGVIDGENMHENNVYTCEMQYLIDKMNLKPVQKHVLSRLLQGYGARAIATERGCSLKTVQESIDSLKKAYFRAFPVNTCDKWDAITEILVNSIFDMRKLRKYEIFVQTRKQKIILPKLSALQIYAKNTQMREKRASEIRTFLAEKTKRAAQTYEENARICAENQREMYANNFAMRLAYSREYLAFLDTEKAAKELETYANA